MLETCVISTYLTNTIQVLILLRIILDNQLKTKYAHDAINFVFQLWEEKKNQTFILRHFFHQEKLQRVGFFFRPEDHMLC